MKYGIFKACTEVREDKLTDVWDFVLADPNVELVRLFDSIEDANEALNRFSAECANYKCPAYRFWKATVYFTAAALTDSETPKECDYYAGDMDEITPIDFDSIHKW